MAAEAAFFMLCPRGAAGGGGWAQPTRPAGPEARPDMLGRSPSAAPPRGRPGKAKTTGCREKGREKRKNPWLYNASTHDTIRTVCI